MRKIYKIIPTDEPYQYTLFQNDEPILTDNSSVVLTNMVNRIANTEKAIRQHGGEPIIETRIGGGIQIVTIDWEGGSKTEMRCVGLSVGTWLALEELAQATNSLAKTGKYAGQPSWRALIRRIAEGELTLQPGVAGGEEVRRLR